ncbi:MAG: OmpA family protein [Alphaproteobacteria bacterium]
MAGRLAGKVIRKFSIALALTVSAAALSSGHAWAASSVHSGAVTINMDVLNALGEAPKPVIRDMGQVPARQAPQYNADGSYTYVAPQPRQMTAQEAVAMVPPPMQETGPQERLTQGPLDAYNSVTVLHSPDMEDQKAADGKLDLDDETWDFINELRTLQKTAPEPKVMEITPAQPASYYRTEQRRAEAGSNAPRPGLQTASVQPQTGPAYQSPAYQSPTYQSGQRPGSPDMSIVADASGPVASGSAQDTLIFGPSAATLAQSEKQKVLSIAARHQKEGGKLQVIAYADDRSLSAIRARQLSLRRALIVRRELIDAGVPADAIDVRAQATPATGSPDRADIIRL